MADLNTGKPAAEAAERRTPEEVLAALAQCYAQFGARVAETGKNAGIRDTLAGLVGKSQVKRDRGNLIEDVHGQVQALVAELTAAVGDCPEEERGRWAGDALEQILILPHGADRDTEFMLTALDGLALPLVPLADADRVAELTERYQQLVPRRQRMPNQEKVLAAMKKRRGT